MRRAISRADDSPYNRIMRISRVFVVLALIPAFARAAAPVDPSTALPAERAAILRELSDWTPAGFNRRLGPDYAHYHSGQPAERFPEVWMAQSKKEEIKGARRYQVVGPWSKKSGDFSSTQGQILYVPAEAGMVGVDRVTILEWSNNCFSERPEIPWWGGFRPEPASKKWLAANASPGVPVAMARGMASWANCGVVVFSSGLVGSAGTCTGRGLEPTLQLPPTKLPTAISVTNKSEFALITVIDTESHKGQVAVIAIESNGKKVKFVHEWQDAYPGLCNVAVITGFKLLGYIDLPEIEFPTSICGVGNAMGGRMNGRDGNAGLLREYDLAKQADRDVFLKGSNKGYSCSAGFAVVASKYQNKAAFIDLQPLFGRVREMYFTTEENYAKTRDQGAEPGKWPYTFEHDPSWKPAVVKTIDVPQPTAVLASMSGGAKNARAFIASMDGTLTLYSVGGLADDTAANPADIVKSGEVNVGRNPTCLAYQKHSNSTITAVSRGDRQIAWVSHADKKGQIAPVVTRTLRDARLIDPVAVEMADTHGVETNLITVCDFAGKQVLNYRTSQLVWATQGGQKFGMGAEGKDDFECGGLMEFPGNPFCVSASNVN